MTVNKFKPHVFVLPEDDANRQLANGFILEVAKTRNIQILPEAGGWVNVCELFHSEHISAMRSYPHRIVVLLLDFDENLQRSEYVRNNIPDDLKSRVFLLGARSTPEALRTAGLGSYENIGRRLAVECRDRERELWSHDLLSHNEMELTRLETTVRAVLF